MLINSIIRFTIEAGICLVSLYLLYWFFLRKETFYQLNRFYLISAIIFSFVLPLLELPILNKGLEAEFMTSVSSIRQSIIPVELLQPEQALSIQSHPFNWIAIILAIYFLGTVFLIARMVYGIVKILMIKREGIEEHFDDYTIIYTERNISPFSFYKYVFLRESLHYGEAKDSILHHENVHIIQRHTYDNIFIEFAVAIFWFNPIIWFYKEAIKSTHEYLADEGAISRGDNQFYYKFLMLEQVLGNPEISVSNSFASRIRKRLVRINREPSKTAARRKILFVIPLIFVLTFLFAGQDPNRPTISQYPPIIYDSDSIPVFYMGQHVYNMEGEDPATFKGGPYQDFETYVSKQLTETEVKAKPGTRGLVIVKFIVDYTGEVSFARAVLADDPEIEAESLRIIKSSPKWEPATMNGEDVHTVFIWPLRFAQ